MLAKAGAVPSCAEAAVMAERAGITQAIFSQLPLSADLHWVRKQSGRGHPGEEEVRRRWRFTRSSAPPPRPWVRLLHHPGLSAQPQCPEEGGLCHNQEDPSLRCWEENGAFGAPGLGWGRGRTGVRENYDPLPASLSPGAGCGVHLPN